MIQEMKKIMIACLADDKQSTISTLQNLGTFHVVNLAPPTSAELDDAKKKQARLTQVLASFGSTPAGTPGELPPEQVVDLALERTQEIKTSEDELNAIATQIKLLAPWGSFKRQSLDDLAKKGIFTALCSGPASKAPQLPDGCAMQEISVFNHTRYFIVFSHASLESVDLPRVQLPENTNLEQLQERRQSLLAQQQKTQQELGQMAAQYRTVLQEYATQLENKLAFLQARDGMEDRKKIAYLAGYAPADKVDALRAAAHENGWAIHYEEVPEDDTEAPTNLIIPKHFRMAQWIFDFVGILPGYHETDVSISMLIFLSVFCGMLVGDAGYGALMTALVLFFRRKVTEPKNRQGMNLLLTMSLVILFTGALTGNWFAIQADKLPAFMRGLPWLSGKAGQAHVQLVCFFIGAFHMSMARIWNAVKALLSIHLETDGTKAFLCKGREVLGHVGWAIFLWANYGMASLLIVDGGSVDALTFGYRCCYVIGGLMILLFSVNWFSAGDVIYIPFTFINSFVDTLSYIRLFAVGLSSFYIADSFNGMAASLSTISPWLIPVSILVLAMGHALNIALACMSVLVHGIRLNTLEFSGHMGISWSGKAYRPLKKK